MVALWSPAAGQTPTAAQFATLVPKYARKTADTSLSTAVLTNDGTLFLPNLSVSVEYECMCYVLSKSAGSTNLNADFTLPSGANIDNATIHSAGTSLYGITNPSGAVSGMTNTTTNRPNIWRFILVMGGVSGTLQFRWAAATGTVTVSAGSYIIARQVT